jgi:hypothetical protein
MRLNVNTTTYHTRTQQARGQCPHTLEGAKTAFLRLGGSDYRRWGPETFFNTELHIIVLPSPQTSHRRRIIFTYISVSEWRSID